MSWTARLVDVVLRLTVVQRQEYRRSALVDLDDVVPLCAY